MHESQLLRDQGALLCLASAKCFNPRAGGEEPGNLAWLFLARLQTGSLTTPPLQERHLHQAGKRLRLVFLGLRSLQPGKDALLIP